MATVPKFAYSAVVLGIVSVLATVVQTASATLPCLQKTFPPSADQPYLADAQFGGALFVPNDQTMVTYSTLVQWNPSAPSTQATGGIWISRRADDSLEGEFAALQMLGKTDGLFKKLLYATGINNNLIFVGSGDAIAPFHYNHTVMLYDADTALYSRTQFLDVGTSAEAAPAGVLATCNNWAIALFYAVDRTAGTYYLQAFRYHAATKRYIYHSRVLTTTSTSIVIAISDDCSHLVVRTAYVDEETPSHVLVFKYDLDDQLWLEQQRFEIEATGINTVTTMAVTASHLLLGRPSASYNGTNGTVLEGGAVSVYKYNGTHFVLSQRQLKQETPGLLAHCGTSLAFRNQTAIIGCPGYNTTFSFASQCEESDLCNTSVCADPDDVPGQLFIRGRADQYHLNATSSNLDFAGTRDEVCNSSLPWSVSCAATNFFGAAVDTRGNRVWVGAPFDETIGQVYSYTETLECDLCPCTTHPPCENGGVCRAEAFPPFFDCACPTNFTGVHCGDPVPPAPASVGGLDAGVITVIVFASVFGVVLIVIWAMAQTGWCQGKGRGASRGETGGYGSRSGSRR